MHNSLEFRDFVGKVRAAPRKDNVKGDRGCVLVIGGSDTYVGAPLFAGMAAFRSGVDLVYILAGGTSIIPLKSALPEAVVAPISYVPWILDRTTSCVFGPGMGREISEDVLNDISRILKGLLDRNIPIIVDGDGLAFYSRDLQEYDHKNIILTPNFNEIRKISHVNHNHILVEKGPIDRISACDKAFAVNEPGSPVRCCGQGDLLTGVMASSYSKIPKESSVDVRMMCSVYSCVVIRRAARRAYDRRKMSLMARDIVDEIGYVIDNLLNNDPSL